ncbi:TetR/AcrR family transcriptional regulator [Tengunoibacter tsumagoiensis]|uniref:HTH tetR-type domain-containing protein n=1 Tax=Tengunoibacter tsumagoiensis TaxID=2014871 RepID=A0A401ZWM3_9CHLR|nr:TetR/AcrR family transcriptional regulator [Tengunoibacter tsumagoiensis]GCE11180.1 hypothetical protein KTT_10390 [Tengunoibacter tsumagoiensis]
MHETSAPRSLKEKQRLEREGLILQTAEEVLLEKGYHEMSMDEIAARVGIAKGTLYLHFAKKEDLVLALLERELATILRLLEQAQRTDSANHSATQRLESVLETIHRGLLIKRGRLLYLIFNTVDLRPVMREKQGALMHNLEQLLQSLLEEGKATGEFDPSLPTALMQSMFFGTLFAVKNYRRLIEQGESEPEQLIDCVKRMYFRSILAPSTGVHKTEES